MIYIFAIIFGYFLGSIPFGLVLCKIFGLGDIRKIGSGNIGATNVLRTGNKPLALATLLLDSGKGAIAVILLDLILKTLLHDCATYDWGSNSFPHCYPDTIRGFLYITALGAILGHLFPIWLKFKGGKGVATTLGTLIALTPILGGIACMIWMVVALTFRISSLAALVAIGLTPLISHYLYNDPNLSGFCAAIAALIYIKHRENIKRLFKGEEPKIGQKK